MQKHKRRFESLSRNKDKLQSFTGLQRFVGTNGECPAFVDLATELLQDSAFMSPDEDSSDPKIKDYQTLTVPWRSELATTLLHALDSLSPASDAPRAQPRAVRTLHESATPDVQQQQHLLKRMWAVEETAREGWSKVSADQ